MRSETPADKPDYGIDAPGIRLTMIFIGAGGLSLSILASLLARRTSGKLSALASVAAGVALLAGLYGAGMAGWMTRGSRVGKIRNRETLLDMVGSIAPWTGDETLLDVGCGRGMMLIGAAKRLTTGYAVGLDIWRAQDQTDNRPEALLRNAQLEGVGGRVVVQTADARALPFEDACFDVVLSHWVIHNLPSAADRGRALDEMLRVLRPGGVLVLADISHFAEYLTFIGKNKLKDVQLQSGGTASLIVQVLSGGSFRPQAIVGLRPHPLGTGALGTGALGTGALGPWGLGPWSLGPKRVSGWSPGPQRCNNSSRSASCAARISACPVSSHHVPIPLLPL